VSATVVVVAVTDVTGATPVVVSVTVVVTGATLAVVSVTVVVTGVLPAAAASVSARATAVTVKPPIDTARTATNVLTRDARIVVTPFRARARRATRVCRLERYACLGGSPSGSRLESTARNHGAFPRQTRGERSTPCSAAERDDIRGRFPLDPTAQDPDHGRGLAPREDAR
jgi:hypothetical protein